MKKALYVSFIPALIWLSGCAQTPVQRTFPYSEQQKIQAAHHWEVLATDVAGQVKTALSPSSMEKRTVFVSWTDETVFHRGFSDLLITRLVAIGVPVVEKKERDSLKLNFTTQAIYHKEKRLSRPPAGAISVAATLLAAGVWVIRDAFLYGSVAAQTRTLAAIGLGAAYATDLSAGMISKRLPNTEVIITTSIVDKNRFVMRNTDVYYVNDADRRHYQKPAVGKTIPLTNKE